jgi:hypothetical protein
VGYDSATLGNRISNLVLNDWPRSSESVNDKLISNMEMVAGFYIFIVFNVGYVFNVGAGMA